MELIKRDIPRAKPLPRQTTRPREAINVHIEMKPGPIAVPMAMIAQMRQPSMLLKKITNVND
jgi:hypothetical protein